MLREFSDEEIRLECFKLTGGKLSKAKRLYKFVTRSRGPSKPKKGEEE